MYVKEKKEEDSLPALTIGWIHQKEVLMSTLKRDLKNTYFSRHGKINGKRSKR